MAIEIVSRRKKYRAFVLINRKRVRKSFQQKADAVRWERKMLAIRDGAVAYEAKPKSIETVSLNELRQRFVEKYATLRQVESTRLLESGLYENHIKEVLGGKNIRELNESEFESFFEFLSTKQLLSNNRINRIRRQLHCMFGQAVRWKLVEINPLTLLKPLPDKNYLKDESINYLTQSEAERLLDWCKIHDSWLYPKILVLLNTGIRFGEMVGLQPRDITLSSGGCELRVSRAYCRLTFELRNRTKGNRARLISLPQYMAVFLSCLARGKRSDDPLLWTDWVECKYPTKFNKHFRKALHEAEVRKVRVHDMRHTFAVHFLERGGHLYDLQRILGHQSMDVTERYSHFSRAMSERSRGLVNHHAIAVTDGALLPEMSPKSTPNQEIEPQNPLILIPLNSSNLLN